MLFLAACAITAATISASIEIQKAKAKSQAVMEDAVAAGYATKIVDVSGKEVIVWKYQLKQSNENSNNTQPR